MPHYDILTLGLSDVLFDRVICLTMILGLSDVLFDRVICLTMLVECRV
jgi:hypothetical protein